MTTHLFPTKQPVFAVGQKLFAKLLTPLTFDAYSFVPNLNNTSNISNVNWDFGDGSVNLADGTTNTSVTHKYEQVGPFMVTCEVMYGDSAIAGETGQSVQTTTREIEVVILTSDVAGGEADAPVPWVAAIHDTFRRDVSGHVRHALVLLPALSAVVTDEKPGQWGTADGFANVTDKLLAKATDDAASRLQASYAAGLGRMAFPVDQLEQAVWAEMGLESVAIGTSGPLASKMTAIENAWREFIRGSGDGHRLVTIAEALDGLYQSGGVPNFSGIKQLPWTPERYLTAGTSSVRTADVMRWLEYANQEIDDRIAQGSVATALGRRLSQQYVSEVPSFHADTAWAWETAQAVAQCIYAFYCGIHTDADGTNPGADMVSARVLALGDPATRNLTVFLADSANDLWAVWQVGLVANEGGSCTLANMRGKADNSMGAGKFVGVRGVAYKSDESTFPCDIGRLESFFSPELRQATSTFDGTVSGLSNIVAQDPDDLATVTIAYPQDGAKRRYATPLSLTYVADVVRQAIAIDSFDNQRGGLRPHAALAVALAKRVGSRQTGKGSN